VREGTALAASRAGRVKDAKHRGAAAAPALLRGRP
jgi:hypothetical protein